jgi:hypothetical protein
MTSMNADHLADLHASTAQIAAAGRIATALVAGFGFCADEGYPLTERQRVELLKAALIVFDDFRGEVESHIRIGTTLRAMSENGHNGAPAPAHNARRNVG